jgi:hypothetical protein
MPYGHLNPIRRNTKQNFDFGAIVQPFITVTRKEAGLLYAAKRKKKKKRLCAVQFLRLFDSFTFMPPRPQTTAKAKKKNSELHSINIVRPH